MSIQTTPSLQIASLADFHPTTLIEVLRFRAQHQPDHHTYTFLIDGEEGEVSLTNLELDRRARAIGQLLTELDAYGERVLLLYPPGLEFVPAFWGCLYAGATAVPAYPPRPNRSLRRLQAIVADAGAAVVLTTSAILSRVGPFFEQLPGFESVRWIATENLEHAADHWQPPISNKDSLAFIQYTSGSTGDPKGVMLTHENLLHNAFLIHRAVEHKAGDKYVSWLPPFHDMGFMAGVLEPLYGGLPAILMSPASFLQRPVRWLQAISRYQATTSGGPNFAYDLCVRKVSEEQRETLDLSSWSVAFNGAESVRPETLEKFAQTFASCGFRREVLYPCYGLAEATLMVSGSSKPATPIIQTFDAKQLQQGRVLQAEAMNQNARALVACGRTMLGQTIVIAHPESATECAQAEVGEIWLRGKSVAQGYWNRPEETQDTFHAYLTDSGEGPFLRTGDLGFLQASELFVTGRLKDLIIIRGRNHYPQDIEHTVAHCHPDLPENGAAAFSVDAAGEERLVVFQEVGRRWQHDPSEVADRIRQAVAGSHELQAYAVVLVRSGSIPRTSSGKIQRHACRDAFLDQSLDELFRSVLDQSSIEWDRDEQLTLESLLALPAPERPSSLVAELRIRVARLLKITADDINPEQPLTVYGLDSLAAISLKHELESEWMTTIQFEWILHNGTVARLAELILEQLLTADFTSPIILTREPRDGSAEFELSFVQQTLWFLYQLAPESGAYNIASAFRIRSEIDVAALRIAFQSIVDRHAALRTTYSMRNGQPMQQVHVDAQLCFCHHDASGWGLDELQARLEKEADQTFNLVDGPVFKVHLFTRSAWDHTLLLTVHHIAFDGWSFWLLMKELNALYRNARTNSEMTLPAPVRQYSDYVRWLAQVLSSSEGTRLSRYWHRELGAELSVPILRISAARPLSENHIGDSHAFTLSEELTTRLRQLCVAEGTTLYTILLTAFQALLHKYTGQEDLVVGSPVAGRSRAEFESVIGCFMNPVGLRCDMSGDPTVKDLIAQVHGKAWKAIAHQEYPSHLLAQELRPARPANHLPLFPVMFIMQKPPRLMNEPAIVFKTGQSLQLGDLELEIIPLKKRFARSELELEIVEADEQVFGEFQYKTDVFDQLSIARMAAHYETLLTNFVVDPERRLSSLQMLTPDERQVLLFDWTHDAAFSEQSERIEDLFYRQVLKTPDKAAAVYEGDPLAFLELQQRSNKLASLIVELKNDRK